MGFFFLLFLPEWPLRSLASYRPSCTSNIFFPISATKSEPAAKPPPQTQVPLQVFTAQGHEEIQKCSFILPIQPQNSHLLCFKCSLIRFIQFPVLFLTSGALN